MAFIGLILLLFLLNKPLERTGMFFGEEINIYIKGGILFSIITWIYTSIYLGVEKIPFFQKIDVKKSLPFFWSLSSLTVALLFMLLIIKGPFLRWIYFGSWFLYVLWIVSLILYYFLIYMIVYRVSDQKENVLHLSYAWSLGTLFIFAFLF